MSQEFLMLVNIMLAVSLVYSNPLQGLEDLEDLEVQGALKDLASAVGQLENLEKLEKIILEGIPEELVKPEEIVEPETELALTNAR